MHKFYHNVHNVKLKRDVTNNQHCREIKVTNKLFPVSKMVNKQKKFSNVF